MARRRRGERGSVLILVPAGVLVLLILGAICVDFSIAYLAQRQLHDAATAAVNDAAGAALDEARLRTGGSAVLDPDRAADVVRDSLAASVRAPVELSSAPRVAVEGTRVTVALEGDAPYLCSGAVPGAPKRAHVRAVATAELRKE
jgi:Flp pilus assembly protein TadG